MVRDDAAGRGQAEGVGGVVDVAPGAAALDARGARRGSTRTPFIGDRSIDQPVVADAQAGAVVAAAADGEEQRLVAGEVDAAMTSATSLQRAMSRGAVDHRVVDAARGVVLGVAGLNEPAAQGGRKLGNPVRAEHGVLPCVWHVRSNVIHAKVVRPRS